MSGIIIDPVCVAHFSNNNIQLDKYRMAYNPEQLKKIVEDYQYNIFWRHFMATAFTNRTKYGEEAKRIENIILAQVNLKAEFISLYYWCLDAHTKSYEGQHAAVKTEIAGLTKKSNGFILLTLANINKISEGEVRNKNDVYVECTLLPAPSGAFSADSANAFGITIDVDLSFVLGGAEFNLVNLHWKSKVNNWDPERSLVEQLPGLIITYFGENLFNILVHALGSITRTVEFIWNLVNNLLKERPQLSEGQEPPTRVAFAEHILAEQIGFSKNENSFSLAADSMKENLKG
jgi:hypothetical protein